MIITLRKDVYKLNIILYSTGCPKCQVLKKKLESANIKYTLNNNVEEMQEKGFYQVPVLGVDDKYLDFKEANEWINNGGMNV